MMKHLVTVGMLVLIAGMGIVGCPKASDILPDAALVGRLQAEAAKLAQSEMEKINAIQATYKTQTFMHPNAMNPMAYGTGAYLKMYAECSGYSIKDIVRSTSLLRPFQYRIEYQCTLYTTTPAYSGTPDSKEKAIADSNFSKYKDVALEQVYDVTPDGIAVKILDGNLPQMNYYAPGRPVDENSRPVPAT